MLPGKSQGATRPTAMGSMLQASTYGQTIPTIYGLTQSPLLAIWAANLRQGGSMKKFKQMKKGITAYVENIDLLVGHNPVMGVLQLWINGAKIPLKIIKCSTSFGGGPGALNPEIAGVPDPYAYALIGATFTQNYSVNFNDYGSNGPVTVSGSWEVPLWNELQNGPDPAHASMYRNYPYCYRWIGAPPYVGNTPLGIAVWFDAPDLIGTVNLYYVQVMAATSYLPPLTKERLFFEPQLGEGDEYSEAGLSSQQIVYPMFAGIGSNDIDLGSGGVIPQLQAEIASKFGLYATGDADFADMIEDVFKSGIAQAAIGSSLTCPGTSQVGHGLSNYQYPGCVQMKCATSVETFTFGPMTYNMPVTEGNFLVVVVQTGGIDGGTYTISDSMSNTWTQVATQPGGFGGYSIWYAKANASGTVTVTVNGIGHDWTYSIFEVAGVDTVDSVVTGSNYTATVTTTNAQDFPAYLMAIAVYASGTLSQPVLPQWNLLTGPNTYGNIPAIQSGSMYERSVRSAGTYSITVAHGSAALESLSILAFKATQPSSNPKPVTHDFMDFPSLDQVRRQCRASGLWGSLSMNAQQTGSDWLKMLYQAANAAPVFMGFKLYSLPYSEVSAAGNGATYNAATASGPVANLNTETGDFIDQKGDAPITVKTAARVDQPNVLQMQCLNRNSDYNPSVVEQPDAASISLFGVRKADPIVNNAVQDVAVARMLLGIQVRRLQYGGDVYSFSVPAKWVLLAPMDLITVTDPLADINQIPVRLTSITEQMDGTLDCEAEPFIYGMCAPIPFTTDEPAGSGTSPTNTSAGNVNTPIFFEAVPRLVNNANQGQLWIVVSSPSSNYGGCQAYISTDGGNSYFAIGPPIVGSALTGVSTADWPAASDPDTANNLSLDLTESLGMLDSYNLTAENNFQYPCYIAGGGSYSIPYELMTYAVATLTAQYKYTLEATGTGNRLRRGVFNAPAGGIGVDHPSGSRWAFLNPSGQGILKLPLDPAWIGTTLYFKFLSSNNFFAAVQSLSDVTVYSYTPIGTSGAGPTQLFQVNGQ